MENSKFADVKKEYTFNREKYGAWNDPSTFQGEHVNEVTKDEVIQGMAQ